MDNVIPLHLHPRARARAAGAVVSMYAQRRGLNAAAIADEAQRARVQVISGASVSRAISDARRRIDDDGPRAA